MLQILPPLALIAAIASATLLIVLWYFEDLRGRKLAMAAAWFLIAAYCQFFGDSPVMGTVGLTLQTVLVIWLIIRWRIT